MTRPTAQAVAGAGYPTGSRWEVDKLLVVVYVIAAVVAGAPVLATVLVTVASRREDSAASLAGPARGPAQAWARHILGFRCEGIRWPQPGGSGRARYCGPSHVREPLSETTLGGTRAEARVPSLVSR
jgi:hypothetical protein